MPRLDLTAIFDWWAELRNHFVHSLPARLTSRFCCSFGISLLALFASSVCFSLYRSPPLPSQLLSSGFNCGIFMQHSGNLHCDNFVLKKSVGFWLWTLLGLFALLPLDGRDYVTPTQIAYVKTSERNVGSNCANSGLSICLFSAPSNSLMSLTNSLKVWKESDGLIGRLSACPQ